jgi:RNA polymerase sigma factor (sigma-70 family)
MQDWADMELLRAYVRQDSDEAFAALVTRYVNLVYSAAMRKTGHPDAAGEITQAVFILLARKARGLGRETVLSGWLYQTARLTAANYLRTEIRRARREQEAYMQSPVHETEAELWPQILPLLEDAMGRLGEKDRNAIALRFFEGRNFKEVGASLGTGEDAAKMRVNRALEKLRQFFIRRGVSSTAAIIAGALSAHSVQAAPVTLAPAVTAVALAKGAAVGGSTLTLVKGALKLMAWTKVKTAVVVGVAALLASGATTMVVKEIRERGPLNHAAEFHGKSVGYWVHKSLWGMYPADAVETYGALRHLGAPAAALLVQALTQTNSPPENPGFAASAVRQNAFSALEQMGPAAKSQVPELIGLLKYDDQDVRIWATLVLAGMGPAAKAAVPALMDVMDESRDANYVPYAKEALRQIKR